MRREQLTLYKLGAEKFLARLQENGFLAESVPFRARFFPSREPVPWARRLEGEYREIRQGEKWGVAWESAWFHLVADLPGHWPAGADLAARLDFNGECCVFEDSGCPVAGLSNGSVFSIRGRDMHFLPAGAGAGGRVELWVEAAASGLVGIHQPEDAPRDCPARHGTYEGRAVKMELGLLDRESWSLALDFEVLLGVLDSAPPVSPLEKTGDPWGFINILPRLSPRSAKILYQLNRAVDAYRGDRRRAGAAREVLAPLLSCPANASEPEAVAVGHAHIDTGWLWPVRETVRKCARTFANQVSNLEEYPDFIFGASQAQHYAFTKEYYPALYAKIRRFVEQGRWEIQGGMWVEADCNIIGGESLVRQFLHGKNFFRDEFGVEVKNLWLPDVFGFSAALPQVMKKAGVDFFLTTKLSWNDFNKFPHNTFRWRGIDGTEVLVHCPPEDTYNSHMQAAGQARARDSFKESHLLDTYLCPYGVGDGGGGPKREEIERVRRMADLEGCPRVAFGRADAFFERLAPRAGELERWDGELYLERHRGTLTTQARVKKGNRLLERKLREVEFAWSALPLADYPAAELDRLWKTLLLNQFHDILPGSSIGIVYETTESEYGMISDACDRLLGLAASRLGGEDGRLSLVNTLACDFRGAVRLPGSWGDGGAVDEKGRAVPVQLDPAGGASALVAIPACGTVVLRQAARAEKPVPGNGLVLENELVRYAFADDGTLLSALDRETGLEMLRPGCPGNLFSLYPDHPRSLDAWEVEITCEEARPEHARAVSSANLGSGPVRSGLRFRLAVGDSVIEQDVYLGAGSRRLDFETAVEWRERHRMLRVAFPVAVPAPVATCDIQFGFLRREVHRNTSWDMARFEVVAHRYADVSNADFGAALLNDCKYGHNLHDGVLDLNLLRSPTYPDPDADQGRHFFRYAFLPHAGSLPESGVIEEAERFNFPPLALPGVGPGRLRAPVSVSGEGVSLAALKKAEKEDCPVVRLVESRGRHSSCRLAIPEGSALVPCDIMEWRDGAPLPGPVHDISFTPFEIKTFKVRGNQVSN